MPVNDVTVVVPTRNAARTLARCLESVRAQTRSAELIVVDNGSTDGTAEIAGRYADRVLARGPERSAQRNLGWRTGRGEIVVFLDADMVLDPDALAQAVSAFEDEDLDGLVIPESSFGTGFWSRCKVLEKSLYEGDQAIEAARIFRRTALDKTGGFDEELSAFEDWDLTDRVPGRIGRIEARVRHDEGRLTLWAAFTKRRYYGRWLHVYRSRPHARVPSRSGVLHRLIRLGTPAETAGVIALKAVEAVGLALGSRSARAK
jgi:glycosyltransferase involved in cell wall biosynthesis